MGRTEPWVLELACVRSPDAIPELDAVWAIVLKIVHTTEEYHGPTTALSKRSHQCISRSADGTEA